MLRERKFTGSGSDTDIITSSARAYVTALNKLLQWQMRRVAANGSGGNDGGIGNAVLVAGEGPVVVAN
jgi:2-isopropylmalate synthase